jgi:ankyrin repeat protein
MKERYIYERLLQACQQGDLELVKKLLIKKFEVHEATEDEPNIDRRMTPLHYACHAGQLEIVKFLLHQQSATTKTSEGPFFLMVEARGDARGTTPLILASRQGQVEVVRYLIESAGANPESTDLHSYGPLQHACQCDRVEVVRYFVEHVSLPSNESGVESTSPSPLLVASQAGSTSVLNYLLHHLSVDTEARTELGATSLHLACHRGHLDAVRLLVSAGAYVDAQDVYGNTPFCLAARQEHLDVMKYLCTHSKDPKRMVNHSKLRGQTALHDAVEDRNLNLVQYLMEETDIDPNIQDRLGLTALHLACKLGSGDITKYLCQHTKVDVNAINGLRGFSVLHYASFAGNSDIVKLLLTIIPRLVLSRDVDGYTCLHYAANLEVAQLLLENGSTMEGGYRCWMKPALALEDKENTTTRTPLQMAKDRAMSSAKNSKGMILVEYLESFSSQPLAVPSRSNQSLILPGVMWNLKLTDFQRRVADETYSVILQFPVHELTFYILGFLSVQDVMER